MMSISEKKNYNKFLVIQTASIGDVILATPVIEKLHYHFPDASIDFLVKTGNETLFSGHPFLHSVLVWDKSEKKYKNYRILLRIIRDNQYDCVINLQRFASTGFMTLYSGAKTTIGFNKNPFSPFFTHRTKHTIRLGNRHETGRNLDLVRIITDKKPFPVKLYPTKHDEARMSQYKTIPYITISPASLWFTKQYPPEKWIEFIQSIEKSLAIYFLGSGKDASLCDRIIHDSGHKQSINLAGKLNFLESAVLMRDAGMNFMNDSAPVHLASAVNAPSTAIFCSTVPEFGFGPLSENSAVVQTSLDLYCKPCGLHGFAKCPEKHFKCALTIDKDDLIRRIDDEG